MLRHRVIQQCARLAFGISAKEVVTVENNHKNNMEAKTIPIEKNRTKQLKNILQLN